MLSQIIRVHGVIKSPLKEPYSIKVICPEKIVYLFFLTYCRLDLRKIGVL